MTPEQHADVCRVLRVDAHRVERDSIDITRFIEGDCFATVKLRLEPGEVDQIAAILSPPEPRFSPGDVVAVSGAVTGEVTRLTNDGLLARVELDSGQLAAWFETGALEHFEPRDPAGDPICEEDTPDD